MVRSKCEEKDVFLRLVALVLLRSNARLHPSLMRLPLKHAPKKFPPGTSACSVFTRLHESADAYAFSAAGGRIHHCCPARHTILFVTQSPDFCRPDAMDCRSRAGPQHSIGGRPGRYR